MATTPLAGQQQQPEIYQAAVLSGSRDGSGSVGPFFAVISVVMVLAVLSCVLGRVFAGRTVGFDTTEFVCLKWMRRKCQRFAVVDVEVGAKGVDTVENNANPPENDQQQPQPPA